MSASPAPTAPLPVRPSPVPPDVIHDRSGGYRARVTWHALRRLGERAWGVPEDLTEGLSDKEAVQVFRHMGLPVDAGRDWLAFYG